MDVVSMKDEDLSFDVEPTDDVEEPEIVRAGTRRARGV